MTIKSITGWAIWAATAMYHVRYTFIYINIYIHIYINIYTNRNWSNINQYSTYHVRYAFAINIQLARESRAATNCLEVSKCTSSLSITFSCPDLIFVFKNCTNLVLIPQLLSQLFHNFFSLFTNGVIGRNEIKTIYYQWLLKLKTK